jgi:hypothetical protein
VHPESVADVGADLKKHRLGEGETGEKQQQREENEVGGSR